jgi:CheY-like chemotaxis protein
MAKARILIVEDEVIVALDIKRRLEDLGYEVHAPVTSGEDAVRNTKETQPDLVLMDIHLRGDMDGVEAAAEIQQRFKVPVVYLTAHSDQETWERGREAKPSGWVSKPVNTRQLRSVVEDALRLRHWETSSKG